jgi:hypothetical protein
LIVVLCTSKKCTIVAVVTSGLGGGITLASMKKMIPNAV